MKHGHTRFRAAVAMIASLSFATDRALADAAPAEALVPSPSVLDFTDGDG